MEYMVDDEIRDISNKITDWYKSNKSREITLLTVPFNTTLIFKDMIIDIVNNDKKVLFVWGKNREDRILLSALKEVKKNITSAFIQEGTGKCDITFVNYNFLEKVSGEYEMIIFDDISNFSNLTISDVVKKEKILKNLGNRIIIYSIEEIIENSDVIDCVPVKYKFPFVEPRVLNTRINLNRDIPNLLYDYLVWFAENKRKIIIFVPDEEKIISVYEYFTKKLRMKHIKIVPLLSCEEKSIKRGVLKNTNEATIIVTDAMEENLENSDIGNVIVLFASDPEYDYKKLVYLCGEVGRITNHLPEVLLVGRDTNEDIDKVKKITREFNKKKWEKNLVE